MTFQDLVQTRRSHRKFQDREISGDDVRLLLRAALMAPTSKNTRSWQFIVVDDALKRSQLADAKELGGQFIKDAPLAVVVCADPTQSDCWIEDCSIAAISMQYQAEELGLGSCWAQMRGRGISSGISATEIIRGILNLPEQMEVLCVIAFGYPADQRQLQNEDRLKWEQVHINSIEND